MCHRNRGNPECLFPGFGPFQTTYQKSLSWRRKLRMQRDIQSHTQSSFLKHKGERPGGHLFFSLISKTISKQWHPNFVNPSNQTICSKYPFACWAKQCMAANPSNPMRSRTTVGHSCCGIARPSRILETKEVPAQNCQGWSKLKGAKKPWTYQNLVSFHIILPSSAYQHNIILYQIQNQHIILSSYVHMVLSIYIKNTVTINHDIMLSST